jgi:hypothetical protein
MSEAILNDWSGWLLVFLSFFIVYKFWKVKKDKKLTLAVGFVLLLHHFMAIINSYFYTFPGAEPDPANFHRHAIEWATSGKWLFSVGSNFYEQLLGTFYRIFGSSRLFGEELSILVFLLSCFVLIEIIKLLNISKYTVLLLLIYGLLPTNLIFCSKILREPYQILFFMLSVYWGLRFHLKPTKGAMIFCVFSALIMGLFHKALILYTLFLVPVLFLFFPQQISGSISNRRRFLKWRLITVGLVLVLIIGIFIIGDLSNIMGLEAMESFLSGKGLKYAAEYRAMLMLGKASDARANYGIMLNTSSVITLIRSTSLMFVYYLFAPFPWQVTNWLDLYGVAESLLRLLLITFSIISWYRTDGIQRRIWGLLLVIYFSMSFLWAMGTVNYGTSIRHHILTNWIIIILGGPGLIDFVVRQFRKKSATFKAIKRGA